jgi:hypothetical protein
VTNADSPVVDAAPRSRILGLDDARFLALIGMMATHLWASNVDNYWSTPWVSEIIAGKAAALFAVLAGVGIGLATDGLIVTGRVAAARLTVFGRGLALVVVGMTLGLLPGGIIVILVYYGVAFWLVIPLLQRPAASLLRLAVACAVAWPLISAFLRLALEDPNEPIGLLSANWLDLGDPAAFVTGLLITGVYPALTWVVYPIVGLAVGRLAIVARERGTLRQLGLRLAAVGACVAAAAFALSWVLAFPMGGLAGLQRDYEPFASPEEIEAFFYVQGYGSMPAGDVRWLESPAPHTGTLFDLAITAGLAVAVIGVCLFVRTLLPNGVARALRPAAAAGAAPLTIYTLHVLTSGIVENLVAADWRVNAVAPVPWFVSSPWLWCLHVLGALLIGMLLARLHRRGPLEALVTWTGRLFARVASPRRRRPDTKDAEPSTNANGTRPARAT